MTTIYKYPIERLGEQHIVMPGRHKILSAGLDPSGQLCIWVLVDTASAPAKRTVFVVGTGNPWHEMAFGLDFIGTVNQGHFMWHVFA